MLDFQRFKGANEIQNIADWYAWLRVIGAGSFGQVHEAINVKADFRCAVKILNKKKVCRTRNDREHVQNELAVLQMLNHPHVVHVLELLSDKKNFYCVMELMQYGNLMDHINRIIQRKETLSEVDAAKIVEQILKALNYMHKLGVVHRDLKMENIMINFETCKTTGKKEIVAKVTDMGFATILELGQKTRQRLGTPLYMAPEIVKG